MNHADDTTHMAEVRRQEVTVLRAELDERDALIRDLRADLGQQRRLNFGYELVTTSEQKRQAREVADAFLHGMTGDAA